MCSHYTVKRDEKKVALRDKILIHGAVPRGDIRPTDLAPVIIPDNDDFVLSAMGCPLYFMGASSRCGLSGTF